MGQMVTRTGNDFAPCTAAACLELLRYYRIPLKGKRVTVIGKGINVGLSIALLLLNEEATVSVCHIFTAPAEVRRLCREAEIIVSAAGCAGLIGAEHVRPGQIVKMCIRDRANYYAPATCITAENALHGLPTQVPIHPGAAKYFKEAGVWDDAYTVGQ